MSWWKRAPEVPQPRPTIDDRRSSQSREQKAAEAAEAKARKEQSAAQRRRDRAKRDETRQRALAPKSFRNADGLTKRWRRPLDRAEDAVATVDQSIASVRRASEPGRTFADAWEHLQMTRKSMTQALCRCEDIALAAQLLEHTRRSLDKEKDEDRAEDRERLDGRLADAQDRLRRHVKAMESAAIAGRELVLQSTLSSQDEKTLLDIDSRLRSVCAVLDLEDDDE